MPKKKTVKKMGETLTPFEKRKELDMKVKFIIFWRFVLGVICAVIAGNQITEGFILTGAFFIGLSISMLAVAVIEIGEERIKKNKDEIYNAVVRLRWATGFQIARFVQEKTGSRFMLGYGTLYRALHDLEKHNIILGQWIENQEGRRKYYYTFAGEMLRKEKGGC